MENKKYSVDELPDAMLTNYNGVTREEAETDLKDFITQLEESGLLA